MLAPLAHRILFRLGGTHTQTHTSTHRSIIHLPRCFHSIYLIRLQGHVGMTFKFSSPSRELILTGRGTRRSVTYRFTALPRRAPFISHQPAISNTLAEAEGLSQSLKKMNTGGSNNASSVPLSSLVSEGCCSFLNLLLILCFCISLRTQKTCEVELM